MASFFDHDVPPPKNWWTSPTALSVPILIIGALLLYIMNMREMHFPQEMQLVSGWVCFSILLTMSFFHVTKRAPWRFFFLLTSLYIAMRYMGWRTFETLIYTNPIDFLGMALIYLAEVYSLVVFFLQLFVNFWPVKHDKAPMPADRNQWPTVDIYIPTYTEDIDIVRLTAMAATQIDYPKEKINIYILDDGGTLARRNNPEKSQGAWQRRIELKLLARTLGVHYLTRETNSHAKSGNINHALDYSSGEFLLFLDCDHVPTSDILQETIGYFLKDPKMFLVQTPHFFCNAAPTERSISGGEPVPDESEMFYRIIQPGMDFWNASYFCGSAAIMRRSYLLEVGGMQGESITEDAETAFELHRRGYHSIYVRKPMVCGLAAGAYQDYVLQHTRWAQGMVQLLLLHNPLFARGLTWAQRLCYFNACLFWLFGAARIVYMLAPAMFLILGLNIYHASAEQILTYALPHVGMTFVMTSYLFGGTRQPFFSEVYECIQSVFLTPAVLYVLRHPHKPTFKVTPKGIGMQNEQLNVLSFFFFGVLLLNVVASFSGVVRFLTEPLHRDVIAVTLIWGLYNVFLAILSLGALWERRQLRQYHRMDVVGTALVQFPRVRQRCEVRLSDLSMSGLSFTADLDFDIRDKERIIIEAASVDGLISYFEAEVVRTFKRGGQTIYGSYFLVPEQSIPDVVHYVYGDSGRWTELWNARAKGLPLTRIGKQLVRMGFKGSWVCATIVFRIVIDWLQLQLRRKKKLNEATA